MAAAAWYEDVETARPADAVDNHRLRAFPNEDICMWIPKIDNSRVVRQSNPEQVGAMWRSVTAATLGVIVAVGLLLPSGYGILAGYKLQRLQQERQELSEQKSRLQMEEGRLLAPERLRAIAISRGFVDPPASSVHELSSSSEKAFAFSQSPR